MRGFKLMNPETDNTSQWAKI